MNGFVVSLLFAVAITNARATNFLNCDGVHQITELRVKNCPEMPCEFPRGEDIIADMDFYTEVAATKLKPVLRARVLGMWVNYPIGYDDACDYLLDGECPLQPNGKATYGIRIPVQSSYPKVGFLVEVTLKNEDDVSISCFQLDGKVVD